jgi:flagellar biosynthetic protein FliP
MTTEAAPVSRRSWVGRALLLGVCAVLGLLAVLVRPDDASATTPTQTVAVRADSTPAPIAPIQPIAPITVPSAAPSGAASGGAASGGPTSSGPTVTAPNGPNGPSTPNGAHGNISVSINGVDGKPSQSIVIILMMTVISIAPAALMLCTSFTKIIVVLSLTRNALGLQGVPPNQVLVGLALFLSLFIMGPTLSAVNHDGVQPYLHGQLTASQAYDAGVQPLKQFMLKQTRKDDLASMVNASKEKKPASQQDVSMTTLVPAFILSELRAGFIIGFVVFIPFLVIDLVVSSSLMSMGMMMLPPSMISLPFKLLLFVMVDGWGLIAHSLITSYH